MGKTSNPIELNRFVAAESSDPSQTFRIFRRVLGNSKEDKQQVFKDKVKIGFFLHRVFNVLGIKRNINLSSTAYSSLLNNYLYSFDKTFTKKSSSDTSNSKIQTLVIKEIKLPTFETYLKLYSKTIFPYKHTRLLKIKNFFKTSLPFWFRRRKIATRIWFRRRKTATKAWFRRRKIATRIWFRRRKTATKAWFGRRKAAIRRGWNTIKSSEFWKKIGLFLRAAAIKIKQLLIWTGKHLWNIIKNVSVKLWRVLKFVVTNGLKLIFMVTLPALLKGIFKVIKLVGIGILKLAKLAIFPLKLIWRAIKLPFKWLWGGLKSIFGSVLTKNNLKKFGMTSMFLLFARSKWFWYSIGFIAGVIVSYIKKLIKGVLHVVSVLGDRDFWIALKNFNISEAFHMIFPQKEIDNQVQEIKNEFNPNKKDGIFSKIVDTAIKGVKALVKGTFNLIGLSAEKAGDIFLNAWDKVVKIYNLFNKHNITEFFIMIAKFIKIANSTAFGRGAMMGASTVQGPGKLLAYIIGVGIALASAGVFGLFSSFDKDAGKINIQKAYHDKIVKQGGSEDTSIQKTFHTTNQNISQWVNDSIDKINKDNSLTQKQKNEKIESVNTRGNSFQYFSQQLLNNAVILDDIFGADEKTKGSLSYVKKLIDNENERNDGQSGWKFFTSLDDFNSINNNPLLPLFNFGFKSLDNNEAIDIFNNFKTAFEKEERTVERKKDANKLNEKQYTALVNFTLIKKAFLLDIFELLGKINVETLQSLIENLNTAEIGKGMLSKAIGKDKKIDENEAERIASDYKLIFNRNTNYKTKSGENSFSNKLSIPGYIDYIINNGDPGLFFKSNNKLITYNSKPFGNSEKLFFSDIAGIAWLPNNYINLEGLKEYIPIKLNPDQFVDKNYKSIAEVRPMKLFNVMDNLISLLVSNDLDKFNNLIDSKKVRELAYKRNFVEFESAADFIQSIAKNPNNIDSFSADLSRINTLDSKNPNITFMIDTLLKILIASDSQNN